MGETPAFGGRLFHRITRLDIGGQEWTLVMTTTRKFEQGVETKAPLFLALGGMLVSVLLAGMVLSLGLSRSRAVGLAEEMTVSLRASEAEARRLAMVSGVNEQRLIALTAQAPGVIFQFEVAPDNRRSFPFISAGYRERGTRISGSNVPMAVCAGSTPVPRPTGGRTARGCGSVCWPIPRTSRKRG